eukprot:UN00355
MAFSCIFFFVNIIVLLAYNISTIIITPFNNDEYKAQVVLFNVKNGDDIIRGCLRQPPKPFQTELLNNKDEDYDYSMRSHDPHTPTPSPTQILNEINEVFDGDPYPSSPNPTLFDETKDIFVGDDTIPKLTTIDSRTRSPDGLTPPKQLTQIFIESLSRFTLPITI